MEIFFWTLVLLGILAIIVLLLVPKKQEKSGEVLLLQQQLADLRKIFDDRLLDAQKTILQQKTETSDLLRTQQMETMKILQEQGKQTTSGVSRGLEQFQKNFETANKVAEVANKKIAEVTEKLVKLEETNKQVLSVSEQLGKLESVLTNPKHRWVLGEYYLDAVLANVFAPSQYQLQYRFKNGEAVDAAIFVRDRIIPVDSKFTLENYNRLLEAETPEDREKYEKLFKQDLKNRIDETSKYIRTDENTMDFSFMFIPSEGVYYDLLVNKVGAAKTSASDLIKYAFQQHVIIVSPTSFYAYLQTVSQGLKLLQVEESAKEIRMRVEDLARHMAVYETFLEKLGTTLSTTVNHYNAAIGEFKKMDKDIYRITEKASGGEFDLPKLDKPNLQS